MGFIFYNLLVYLLLPFLPLRLLWRSHKNSFYRKRIAERFGYYNFAPISGSIWVHVVSVGEALAAVPLIKQLIAQYPRDKIVVTSMTPTGAERIQKIFADEVLHLYVPYDYPGAINRFLSQIKPKLLVIVETEIWPNLIRYTAKKHISILLASARLSQKSMRGYRKFQFLFKPVFSCISKIMAQSKIDAKRFLELGIDEKKISISGNIKFDIAIAEDNFVRAKQFRLSLGENRPIWVAASTHAGEEEKILLAAAKVRAVLPETLLIIVPRHPERFIEVFELCKKHEFNPINYSSENIYTSENAVIIGDVMGQLLLFYIVADVAFVGGSLIPHGGHNLLEPASVAKPVISGPSLDNFIEITQFLLEANGMIVVDDELELADKIIYLLQNKNLREQYGSTALSVVMRQRGATQKIMSAIQSLLDSSSR